MAAVGEVANQNAGFQIWTNQRAAFGSRDRLDRKGNFLGLRPSLSRVRAASGGGNDVTAEMTTEAVNEV